MRLPRAHGSIRPKDQTVGVVGGDAGQQGDESVFAGGGEDLGVGQGREVVSDAGTGPGQLDASVDPGPPEMGDDDVQIRPGVGYGQDVFGIVIPGSVRIVGALAGVDDDGEFVGLAKLIHRIQARVSGKYWIVSRKDLDGHDRAADDQGFEPGDPVRTLGLNVDGAHEKQVRGVGQQLDASGQVADGRAGDIVFHLKTDNKSIPEKNESEILFKPDQHNSFMSIYHLLAKQ